MQPEPKRVEPSTGSADAAETINCANCRATMPRSMRFCRSCGFRLGEGLAEYVETVRLPNQPHVKRDVAAAPAQNQTEASGVKDWGPVATVAHAAQAAHKATDQALSQASAHLNQWEKKRGRKNVHWIVWVVIALIITSVAGGGLLSALGLRGREFNFDSSPETPRSYVGLNASKNVSGGVTFDYVTPPGGPADKAGLLGGDIITSFDGQPVRNTKELAKLLQATPVGKTVDVTFIRDGETKTTKLTTISEDEQDALDDAADERPEGEGYIAEGTDIDVVPAPGTNHNGVRLNDIDENRPADIAGLKDGDIVIEFGGLPMRTRRELESRIVRALPGSIVTVVVIRGTERLEIPVKIGRD